MVLFSFSGDKMAVKKEIIELKNGFTRNQSNTSNAITTAKTKMTANELKAFYQCSTLIKLNDDEFTEYTIDVKQFVENLGFSDTNAEYTKSLCRHLAKQTFEIQKKDTWEIYTIFSRFRFDMKNGLITIKFNEDMRPYLLQLKQNFTQIKQVKYIKEFSSKYSIRIYTMLKDYRLMSQRDFNIKKLAEILQLPKSYQDFGQLNREVLKTAVDEINEKSDIEILEIEKLKTGRKVTDIRIYFRNKSENQAQDFIKYLENLYKLSNKSLAIFKNCFIALTEPKSMRDLYKIHEIQIQDNPKYYTVKTKTEQTLYSTSSKKELLNFLVNGIYQAVFFKCEHEKKQQLDLGQWQTKKDQLDQMKKIFAQWQKDC